MEKENYKTPTRTEFDDYCTKKLHIVDKEYMNALWCSLSKANWRKRNGDIPVDWQTLASAHHGILLQKFGREPKRLNEFTKAAQKHEKTIFNEIEEEFSDNDLHYVCYTDGSCDNTSTVRAGGSAYIVLKNGEVMKVKITDN